MVNHNTSQSLSAGSARLAPTGLALALAVIAPACGDERGSGDESAEPGVTVGSMQTGTAEVGEGGDGSGSEGGDAGRLDVAAGEGDGTAGDGRPPSCKVEVGADGYGDCTERAPADSFDPVVEWSWTAPRGLKYVIGSPLVANLTDDDGNGEIDLCDTPDIVVIAFDRFEQLAWIPGRMFVLDGATGTPHFEVDMNLVPYQTPALGDIDGDGLPEIIAAVHPGPNDNFDWGSLAAFEHDGTLKWISEKTTNTWLETHAPGLADIDNDGDVEIFAANTVFDHEGRVVFSGKGAHLVHSATTAADLDGDDDLEVIVGTSAYFADGSLYYGHPLGKGDGQLTAGFPQVADFDEDPEPEILLLNSMGMTMLEHDGAIKFKNLTPTGDTAAGNNWSRPAAVHDFDGDGKAEFATSSADHYSVFEGTGEIVWMASVEDLSGSASGTAFDFLGDGSAEALYGDEHNLFVFDQRGGVLLSEARFSRTGNEYPVVADVDNDGSAEIIIVSNETLQGDYDGAAAVKVVGDGEDRWIQARRIWNQHTYHVTNVREDGTIPQFEEPHWTRLNTFRTNAQIGGAGVCRPPVAG